MDGSFKMKVMLSSWVDTQPSVLLAPSPDL